MKRKNHITISKLIIIFILFLFMLVTFIPLYYIAICSISDGKYVLSRQVTFFPKGFQLESYRLILKDQYFLRSYLNTIIYTLVGTIINLIFTSLCAYPLSIRDLFGRGFFTPLIIFTMFFSGGMIPNYLLVQSLKLINTIWAIVLPGAISTWNMIVLRTYISGVAPALRESALIDGANDIVILFKIVIPLCIPVYAALTVFYMVGHWNSFYGALIYLNDKSKFPLQIILRNMTVQGNLTDFIQGMGNESDFAVMEQNLKYTAIMISTLPIIMVYPFLQKYFAKGIMVGSLKG